MGHFCVSRQHLHSGPGPKSNKDPSKSDICLRCGNVDVSKKYSPSCCCCSSAPPSGLWSFGWDWSIRPLSSRERRANELRVAVFYGCENQPADAAAARKISLQCMSVTKHTVQRCHSGLSAKQNCARHSDPFEQIRCSLVRCSLYFLSLARTHTTGTGEQNEKLSAEVEMAD